MKNPISDFTDELEDVGKDVAKTLVREAKGMGKIAKDQILGSQTDQKPQNPQAEQGGKQQGGNEKDKQEVDPVTGLPPIKKKATLTNLTQATAQLRMAKLKKLREELEQQRLKVSDKKTELAPIESSKTQGHGPVVVSESSEREPKDNAVANTLKGSKDTGEFKGLIGG